jgi:hypothetical protein
MEYVYDTMLRNLDVKIASLPELKQYQVLMLCNMLVDTIAVTKNNTAREEDYYKTISAIEDMFPRVMDKVAAARQEVGVKG